MVLLVVKPDNHRRVLGKVNEQVVQLAQPQPAEHVDLVQQRARLIRLGVACGEHPVPEERDLLLHRRLRRHHAIEPVRGGGVAIPKFMHIGVIPLDDIVRHVLRIARMQKLFDCSLVAQRLVMVKLRRSCPK